MRITGESKVRIGSLTLSSPYDFGGFGRRMESVELSIIGLPGVPEVRAGDSVGKRIATALHICDRTSSIRTLLILGVT